MKEEEEEEDQGIMRGPHASQRCGRELQTGKLLALTEGRALRVPPSAAPPSLPTDTTGGVAGPGTETK